jgi:hypothetical protein
MATVAARRSEHDDEEVIAAPKDAGDQAGPGGRRSRLDAVAVGVLTDRVCMPASAAMKV